MTIILGILVLVFAVLAVVGWGQYFRVIETLNNTTNALETIKQIYMSTVFAVWQHIEYLELENPEIIEEPTVKTMAIMTGWNSESESDENQVDSTEE